MKKLLVLICCLFLCGCMSQAEAQRQTNLNLKSGGVVVGKIDGRTVRCYTIVRANEPDHYIYLIDDSEIVSVNWKETKQVGETIITEGHTNSYHKDAVEFVK